MVTKYLDKFTDTAKGHLNQQYQNLRSTSKIEKLQETLEQELTKEKEDTKQIEEWTHYIYVDVLDPGEITRGFNILYDQLCQRGLKSHFQVLDNKASNTLLTSIKAKTITYQLVPPHCHRYNATEKAIQTFNLFHCLMGLTHPTGNYNLKSAMPVASKSAPVRVWADERCI
eukprot:7207371-Ditylum_brightwellii.AAC.1